MSKNLDDAIFAKVVCQREGAALRTSQELIECFVDEACGLLDVNQQQIVDCDEESDPVYNDANANEYETQLADNGYTTIWNDGFIIYKDLTEEEADYLSEYAC